VSQSTHHLQRSRKTLGQILLGAGVIGAEDLEQALEHRRANGIYLGESLVQLGTITANQLVSALHIQGKLACINLSPEIIDRNTCSRLTEEMSRKLSALAINTIADVTTVAMSDPADVYVLDELSRTLGTKVFSVYSEKSQIEECIDYIYSDSTASTEVELEEFDNIVNLAKESEVDLKFGQENLDSESEENLDGPVVSVIQAIFNEAFEARASDIHLEPRENTFVVRFRVDGALFDRMVLKKVWARPCVARIKVISNLDIAQRRLPQDGRTQISIGNRKVDLRVSTMPTLLGEGIVIRILDGGRGVSSLGDLGLREDQEDRLRAMVMNSDGIVLAVGPTGSGKTTTLYALLSERDKPDTKIITLEDPVENQMESLCQINCDVKAGLTFSRGLRSILRQDPDVILVGEIRDSETAEITVSAALTGHVVLSTLHTIGSAETITRMREMGVEPALLSDTLRGIVAQRLVRVICPTCKTQDNSLEEGLRTYLGIGDEEFFTGSGCDQCNNTGYRGRRGVYEIMSMSPFFRDALRSGADADKLRNIAIEDGMTTMREEGMRLARAGVTSISEVLATTPQTT
jgi:type IV pilus assembly protein PilB